MVGGGGEGTLATWICYHSDGTWGNAYRQMSKQKAQPDPLQLHYLDPSTHPNPSSDLKQPNNYPEYMQQHKLTLSLSRSNSKMHWVDKFNTNKFRISRQCTFLLCPILAQQSVSVKGKKKKTSTTKSVHLSWSILGSLNLPLKIS